MSWGLVKNLVLSPNTQTHLQMQTSCQNILFFWRHKHGWKLSRGRIKNTWYMSLKTCLKMRSRGQLHHHPLHRRIWKSGHKHTTCTWYTGPIRDYLHMRNRSRCNVTFTAADPSCLRIISFSAQHEALLSRCLHKTLERERERKKSISGKVICSGWGRRLVCAVRQPDQPQ